MPQPRVSSFADDLASVLTQHPTLAAQSHSFADDLADVEAEQTRPYASSPHRTTDINLPVEPLPPPPPRDRNDPAFTVIDPDAALAYAPIASQAPALQGPPQIVRGVRELGAAFATPPPRASAPPNMRPPTLPDPDGAMGFAAITPNAAPDPVKAALSDVIEGAFKTGEPAIALGLYSAPVVTLISLGVAAGANQAAAAAVLKAGGSPESARLAGNAAALLAAGIGTDAVIKQSRAGIDALGRAARDAGDAAVARRDAAGRIDPLPTDIVTQAVQPTSPPIDVPPPFEPIPPERALVRQAPDAPVSPIVDSPAAPPAPVEPITEPGRPGEPSFAEDLAQATTPPGRSDITAPDGSFAADLEATRTTASEISTDREPVTDSKISNTEIPKESAPTFAEDLKQVTKPPDDIPRKRRSLNEPAEKVDYASVTDDQRRELRRVMREIEEFPFVKRTLNKIEAGHGNAYDVVGGEAGAPVYNDIVTTDRAGRPQGTRDAARAAIWRFLYEGKRSALSDRAMDVVIRRLAGDNSLSKPSLPPEFGDLPYGMDIRRRPELSQAERDVEDRFARQIEQNPHRAISGYREKFDNVASTDLAKEIAGPGLYGTRDLHTQNSRALHNPAQQLGRAAFRSMLEEQVPEGRSPIAVFTAGGTGSGKSTSLDRVFPGIKQTAHVVYDTTFSRTQTAIEDVQDALDTGHEALIVHTLRPPVESFAHGVLTRAMEEGRPVTIDSHLRTHLGALETVRAVAEHFKDDPRVQVYVVTNPEHGTGSPEVRDLSALEGVHYNADDVRPQLEAELEAASQAGRISRPVYDAVRGAREGLGPKAPTGRPGQVPRKGKGGGKVSSAAPAIGPHAFRALPNRPQNAPSTPDERLRPSAIIERLRKTIGSIPNRTGRFKQRALGIYKTEAQAIRLKVANDLQTFAHEAGHHVSLGILKLNRKDPRWKKELERVGAATSRPSYTKDTVRKEGEAEFLRRWITDPADVKRAAPNYSAAFEAALKNHPDLETGLREAQADVQRLIAVDPADRAKLHVDFTGNEETFIQKARSDPRRAIRDVAALTIDDLHPLRVAVEQMRDGRELPFRHNAYVLARVARGAAGKAEAFLEHGVRMRNGKFSGPSFADAIQPVHHRMEDFGTYLVALRAEEMHRRGMEAGMSREEAQAFLERIAGDAEHAEFERARDNVYAFQNAVLEYARQFGAMSGEQLKAIQKVNEFYVPMQRMFDATEAAYSGSAKKIADRALPVKRIKGSGRDVVNPFESIVKNTFAMVDMVEKNRSMIALVNQADQSIGSGRWIERIPDPQVATTFNLQKLTGDVRAALEDAGVDLPDNLDDALNELVTVFTPATFGKKGEEIVTVIRKGKRQFWQVNDPALYKAITAMGPQTSGLSLSWFKRPVAVLRAGATLNPGFIIRNPGRDTIVAYFQSRYGFIPVYDTLRGLVAQAVGDKDARQFFASGVAQASLAGQQRRHRRELIEEMAHHGGSFARYIVRHPIDLLRAISEQMEVATRLGEFKLALEAGGVERGIAKRLFTKKARPVVDEETLMRATLSARDVTTDFARSGRVPRELNEFYAFFNAHVQGYVRGVESAKRDPLGVGLKLGALAAFTAALWWLNHTDDDYRKKEDWEKRTYWHWKIGNVFIKIPKPFEWGYVPDAVEATLAYLHEKDPDALKEVWPGSTTEGAMQQVAFSLAPTAIAPLLEAGVNYDMFRDAPIIPEGEQDLDPELQYNQWTSETAKKLGKAIGIAPLLIDHIIYGYGAGMGRIATSGIDAELRRVGLAADDTRPQTPEEAYPGIGAVTKWPIVGPFADSAVTSVVDDGSKGFNARDIKALYDAAAAVAQLEGSVKQYVKTGDRERALARVHDARSEPWFDRRAQVKAAAQEFKELRPFIKAIYAAPVTKMSPAEKRRELDLIADRMDAIAKRALGKPLHHEDVQGDVLQELGIGR